MHKISNYAQTKKKRPLRSSHRNLVYFLHERIPVFSVTAMQ